MKARLIGGFGSLAAALLLLAACSGEDRPQVDVIDGGGTGSAGSASASGAGPAPTAVPGATGYSPVSNVDTYFAIGADITDIRALMAPATQGQPVDWAAVTALYENGKNQVNATTGAVRSLASMPDGTRQAIFPNGASAYGRPNFIDAIVRDGLRGSGRAQGLSDNDRRQIVDKGLLMIAYAVALQEMDAGKMRIAAGNLDNNTGAPHVVDEAWATIVGPADAGGVRANSILAAATSRETNFNLQGKIAAPLDAAFVAALAAAQKGDASAYDRAHNEVKGLLNSIFYLSSLRYAKTAETATADAVRSNAIVEGWAYFQTIRAFVAQGSAESARTVEEAYSRPGNQAFPASATTSIYQAMNQQSVLTALGIPAGLVVRTPPAQ